MKLREVLAAALAATVVLGALCNAPLPAEACGGPEYADLGALQPVGSIVYRFAVKSEDYDYVQREEFRFLYPFWHETKSRLDPLWRFSYPDATASTAPAATTSALDAAVKAGDAKAIVRAAHAGVAAWLAEPPVTGAPRRNRAWRAAELTLVAPHLAKLPAGAVRAFLAGKSSKGVPPAALAARTRAHKARHDFLVLHATLRAEIPNGWGDAIRKQVSAATWKKLERAVDAWLARYPKHPLWDYVALDKERVLYFSGDGAGAWSVLFDVYPRLRVRALAEMRYLMQRGIALPAARLDALKDPALVAAFADESTITPERFKRWWKLAEAHRHRPASINLEERLLYWAAQKARPGHLPPGFPRTSGSPSPLWGKLRAAALIAAAKWPAARVQLMKLPAGPERALLAAHYFVARSRPDLAAAVPKLGGDTRQYLLRVLVGDKGLARLSKGSKPLARAARFEAALRLASSGSWQSAATRMQHDKPAQAKLWRAAGALARSHDPDALLRLARFLEQHREALFYSQDRAMYRAISGRYDPRTNAVESHAIETALARSTPRWLALQAYTRWLEQNRQSPIARSVLTEADDVYNRLTNWAGGNYLFWGKFAPHSALVARLRRVGRTVRAGAP